ncbi:MAG: YkgJ family cysteine cluster protein [Planctomycetota bacterium]|jgi:Fe-S-cluster containining protein
MSKTCIECGAKCCTYFCFEIDEPDDYEEFEDLRWYLCHDGVSIHVDENGDWFIELQNRCKNLTADKRCAIYEDRPLICRKYDPDNCDHASGEYRHRRHFRSPGQLDAYAREVLGETQYEAAKARLRAKIEKKQENKAAKPKKIRQLPPLDRTREK